MKQIDGRLFNLLRSNSTDVALGWLMTRTDGYQLGFTSNDRGFSYLGVEYVPTNAFSGTASTSKSNLSVDNMNAIALISDDITEDDLRAGLYDNADVKVFWISIDHPEFGIMPVRGGTFGELNIKNGQFEIELRAQMQKLQQPFGDFMTLNCSADFGDAKCKMQLDPGTWAAGKLYYASADNPFNVTNRSATQSYADLGAAFQNSNYFAAQNAGSGKGGLLGGGGGSSYVYNQVYADGSGVYGGVTPPLINTISTNGGDGGIGSYVKPSTYTGFWYRCIECRGQVSSVVETETDQGSFGNSESYVTPTANGDPPPSAPSGFQVLTHTVYGAVVTLVQGVSGAKEPVWPTTLGGTVLDGDCLWQAIEARTKIDGVVSAVFNRGQFEDEKRGEALGHWQYGTIQWLTGKNRGLRMEVRAYDVAPPGTFTLLEQMPYQIAIGDRYQVSLGCAKTRNACLGYSNLHNFRGFPDMPTEDKALATPNYMESGTPTPNDQGGS